MLGLAVLVVTLPAVLSVLAADSGSSRGSVLEAGLWGLGIGVVIAVVVAVRRRRSR